MDQKQSFKVQRITDSDHEETNKPTISHTLLGNIQSEPYKDEQRYRFG